MVYPPQAGLNLVTENLRTTTSTGPSAALLASKSMSAAGGPTKTGRACLAVVCLVAVLLTGCGGSDAGLGPDTDPTTSDPGSSSPSQSQADQPADGPKVENAHASYRVPQGYKVAEKLAGTSPANESGLAAVPSPLRRYPPSAAPISARSPGSWPGTSPTTVARRS